jgi:hypothetical protein
MRTKIVKRVTDDMDMPGTYSIAYIAQLPLDGPPLIRLGFTRLDVSARLAAIGA